MGYNDASLGTNTPFNRIVLGSSGHFGVLQGESENASGKYIAHPIVLNGNGGIINASSYGSGNNFSMTFLTDLGNIYHQYLNSLISGSGDLITKGSANVYINNGGYASFTPNTYTGQTRIVNNATDVGTLRSLGTGNVIVDNGATLLLRSSNAVATTATLYVGRSGTGKVFDPAVLKLYYTSGGGIPNLDANSTGILSLNAGNTDAAANNRLKTLLSNTTIFLGYIGDGYDKSTITATNLGVGAGGVYRIAGAGFYPSDYMVLDAPGTTGVLTGPNSLEVGLPYDEWVSYYAGGAPNYHGRLQLKDANDYTGTTTVHLAATLWGDAQTNANTSPFGSTTATVVLNGGTLILNGTTNSVAVSKGALTVQGSGKLAVDDKSSVNQVADITVDSFVRTNHSTLVVYGPNHFGSSERVKIASAPTPANGMVAPYMIGTNAFLNYLGATGFTNAVFTATVGGASFNSGLSAGTDVVNVTATTTLQDNPYIYALRAAAAVTSNGAGKDTVTLGSGGLILNGASYTINPNLAFGTVSGSTTNPVEGVIYAQDSTLDARGRNSSSSTAPLLSGQITAAALTKTGPGYARLSGNNAGTLTGPITINEGGLLIAGWTNLGSSANDVVLNGGHLDATATSAITNAIKIGPLGGILNIKDSNALKTYGGISDLEAGNSGPLRLLGNRIYGTNTYSGGTIIEATMSDDANTAPAPSFGTGPVRIRGGYMYSFLCGAAFVHPARWTLQDGGSGIEIANQPVTLGSLEGCGNVVFGDLYGIYTPANGWTLTVGGDNSDSDYYGIIYELPYRGASNANTPGNLVKLGSGVFTIWGDSTYHGTTVVSNGTLTVNGALCFTTNVTVYSGAVLTGKGTVGGAVTVNGTGRLGGTLFFQSNVTLNASAFVDVTVNGANAFNQLTLQGGTLDLNGATLNLTLGFKPTVGQLFTIANTMGGAVSHQFAQAGTIAASYNGKPYTFRISYTGGNVVLTAMPNGTVISIR